MTKMIYRMLAAGLLATLSISLASAAPPSSCASKFVGTWAYPGGVTDVRADGTAYPHCPMCVPMQTWTCSGNTYFFNGPGSYTATLSPDGQQLIGSVTATRVGGRSSAPRVRAPSLTTSEAGTASPTVNVRAPRIAAPAVNTDTPRVAAPTVRQ
jgi:hypothetical protein